MPRRLTILLTTEALTLGILRLAADVRFDWFAFFDGGAELAVHSLIAKGMRPTIDFGYIYGLLPLLVGDAWYGLFGLRPGAFAAISILGGVLSAWGLARALNSLRVGFAGAACVVVAMPIGLVTAAAPSLTHVIEPILLMHALADLAAGRRARALALASACAFVKPSMAYFAGAAILMVVIARDRPRGRVAGARCLTPSLAVVAILATTLGIVFGPRVLVNSLVPIAGRAVYRANNFGFFLGSGRAFWLPDRPRPRYYTDTFAGPWLVAVVVLSLAGLAQAARSRRAIQASEGRVAEGAEVVVVCAVLHAAFVALLFGNQWSWIYYYPILVLGLAATSARSRAGAWIVALVTALAIPSSMRSLRGPIEAWSGRGRSTVTLGLWASDAVRDEWRDVVVRIEGLRATLLAKSDGAAVLDPRFGPPEIAFLVRGHVLPAEMARKRASVLDAQVVVVANPDPGDPWFDEWPEFADDLRGFAREWSSKRLRVYGREAGTESRISSKKSR